MGAKGLFSEAPALRAVLDAAPDATVVVDRAGSIVYVNPPAQEMFGFAADELVGQPVEVLIPERFRRAHPGHRDRYFHDPRTRPMGAGGLELYGIRKDGTEFPAEISLSQLSTEEGSFALTAIRDVTDRKRAEEERARLHRELQQLLADQNRFFTNVSHELRTPLTLILGPAEKLLASGAAGPGARTDLEVIARNARTLLRQVNDLLDVAKLEAGRMALEFAEVDVARLVRLVASHFEGLAAERRVSFDVEAPPALPHVLDAPKFQRVLLNLLSNAFKFTPDGGRIRCTVRPAGGGEPPGSIALEVADSGPGVPEAHRESVFARFRQLDGPGRPGGTGLGLAISREFVQLHGGRIAIGEAPEGGALVRVVLPPLAASSAASVAPLGDEARAVAEALHPRPVPVAAPRRDAPTVLVVEDNPEMAGFIRDVLAADASVVVASGAREGFERAVALRPDLVLTDLMMPEATGEDLVHWLRSRPDLADVPIVILTAKADGPLRVRLLREGAQDYVMKPFAAQELRARVGALVATKRVRDLLRRELHSRTNDVEMLVRELADRNRELEGALDAARAARDEADRASRVKSDFLALVSHELRTPLAALHLQLERVARAPDLSESARAALPRLRAASRRLATLVDALLEQSRVASGHIVLRREPVELAEELEAAVEEVRLQAEAKGLALALEAPAGLPPIRTDRRLLRLVVSNLIANAVKFTESGRVVVALSGGAGEQRIAVTDTGPGIPQAEQERIFEPFEQHDPIVSKHVPGVGLGLALVRELTAALDGRVELRSRPGAGSTFEIVLPSAPPQEREAGADPPA